MKRFFLLVFIFLLICSYAQSQNSSINGTDIARVNPSSPRASEFQRYGDYPVDLSTGIPNISIPIYEINTGKLKLPISLSFHASGFKPATDNGIVGYGWTLNAGGQISRMMQGDPDEQSSYPDPYKSASQIDINNSGDRNYISLLDLDEAYGGSKDAEYDIFYYNLPTGSGKFLLKNTTGGNKIPITLPFRPVKIKSNSANFNTLFTHFEITDESGTLYRFGRSLSTGIDEIEETYPNRRDDRLYQSAWLLTEIISYDKSDTIKLKYFNRLYDSRGSRSDRFVAEDMGSQINIGNCAPTDPPSGNLWLCSTFPQPNYNTYTDYVYSTHYLCVVKEIEFKQGRIVFEYKDAPIDTYRDMKIDRIKIFNKDGSDHSAYRFYQSFHPGSSKYYRLEKVEILNSISQIVGDYELAYESANPQVPDNYLQNTGIDFWGFYNGKTNNNNLMPAWTVSVSSGQNWASGSADRESDENAMKSFMLKEIKYPTGGKTEFIYEGNRILDGVTGQKTVGGLRIKKIINNSTVGSSQTKTYTYGGGTCTDCGLGNLQIVPTQDYFYQQETKPVLCTSCTGANPPPAYTSRMQILNSNSIDGSGIFENNPVFYTIVTEYTGEESNNTGKTVYNFEEPVNSYGSSPIFRYLSSVQFWKGNNLLKKEIYKKEAASYNLIQKEENTYLKRQTEALPAMKVFGNLFGMSTETNGNLYDQAITFGLSLNSSGYTFLDYNITSGISLLSQSVYTEYTTFGNLQTITGYEYSDYHNNPIRIVTTNSKGEQRVIENKYPPDLTLSGYTEDARIKLIDQNAISNLLDSKDFLSYVQLFQKSKNFKDFGTGIPQPESIITKKGSESPEIRILFNKYDASANIIEQQKPSNVKHSYIWGYSSTYPIAEVINAQVADIFHTSFEEGDGNSTTGDCKTGKKSKTDGFSTSLSNLTSGNYILSYWKKSGTNWNYQSSVVSVTGTTYSISLTDQIDEVRFYPGKAMMTTYTYEPLIGMTSQCDVNNRITYYEYDNFNRLSLIRDQDGNIIKKIDYKYQATTQQ